MKKLLKIAPLVICLGSIVALAGCGSSEPEEEPVTQSGQGSGKFGGSDASVSDSSAPQNPGAVPTKE